MEQASLILKSFPWCEIIYYLLGSSSFIQFTCVFFSLVSVINNSEKPKSYNLERLQSLKDKSTVIKKQNPIKLKSLKVKSQKSKSETLIPKGKKLNSFFGYLYILD